MLFILDRVVLFNLGDLDIVGGQVQVNGRTACVDNHLPAFYKSSFFQDIDLIEDDIIQAFFFPVIKGAYTPAKAQLVHQ